MSFRTPYVPLPTTKPVPSLQGRNERPRSLIAVAIINPADPTQWRRYRACLDTGADDTVFHEDTAALLGIDLRNAVTGEARGTTGAPLALRYAEVFMQIRGSQDQVLEWAATVAFASKRTAYPLLGFAGFLQFFDATFFGASEQVELTPNNLIATVQKTPTDLTV